MPRGLCLLFSHTTSPSPTMTLPAVISSELCLMILCMFYSACLLIPASIPPQCNVVDVCGACRS